jgi:hypothetical protein
MTLHKKYHKYITTSLITILLACLYIGRKVNLSYFWYNERINNYLDTVLDGKYVFVVIFVLFVFCYHYGVKRWNTLFVAILSLILGAASFFNSLVFHRLERLFLIAGLVIGVYAWNRYLKPVGRVSSIVLGLIFTIPLLFDHFLLSETTGVFIILYLSIIGYFIKKQGYLARPLIYGILGFLALNLLVMLIQVTAGRSLGLTLLGEAALNIQNQKGLATDFISDNQFLRGYGLFSHPNIAGFVGSISLLYFIFSDFISSRLRQVGMSLGVVIILLSFSRIAWLSGLVILWYILTLSKVSQKIMNLVIAFAGVLVSFLFVFRYKLSDVYRYVDIQKFLDAYGQTTIIQKFFGVGLGAYPFYLRNQFPNLQSWQFEPVHNSMLLVFIEFGWLSILIMATLIYALLYIRAKKKTDV